ncbi:hypothetical protein ACFFVB_12035 [Formosa undariae]|uniref:Uncharacterized protein n=1 Tax=Formosa undariae TaxID=1325436 RepID=A0ABV5F2Y0_9FLAO
MDIDNEIEKLKKENKTLKQTNMILTIFVTATVVIMIYNNFIA